MLGDRRWWQAYHSNNCVSSDKSTMERLDATRVIWFLTNTVSGRWQLPKWWVQMIRRPRDQRYRPHQRSYCTWLLQKIAILQSKAVIVLEDPDPHCWLPISRPIQDETSRAAKLESRNHADVMSQRKLHQLSTMVIKLSSQDHPISLGGEIWLDAFKTIVCIS